MTTEGGPNVSPARCYSAATSWSLLRNLLHDLLGTLLSKLLHLLNNLRLYLPRSDEPPPSPDPPLLALCEDLPELFAEEVLKRLNPTDIALLARVARGFKAAVVASGLPLVRPQLKVKDFVGSVERLAWAKENMCPWDKRTCAYVAQGGHLEVLIWAREQECPCDLCMRAAKGGHLEVLRWAWEQRCP